MSKLSTFIGSTCTIAGERFVLADIEEHPLDSTYRWLCSCGSHGQWTGQSAEAAAFMWPRHLHKKHELPYEGFRRMAQAWREAYAEEHGLRV